MSGTVRAALAAAAARLAAAGVPDPARDARLLMADALGTPLARLTLLAADPLPSEAEARFAAHVAARLARRPVSQILARRVFWGRDFEVTSEVLDPRPETETIVALALRGPEPARLLDLGVGSGALLVTLLCEWPRARGLGTDLSEAALAVARRNAARHGVADRAELRWADWTEGLEGPFDLVVCNPPYVPEAEVAGLAPEVRDWEPRAALTPGPGGLESYERIAHGLARLLAPAGRALLEFGAGQGAAAAAVFQDAGFASVALRADLDGRERVLEALDPRAR